MTLNSARRTGASRLTLAGVVVLDMAKLQSYRATLSVASPRPGPGSPDVKDRPRPTAGGGALRYGVRPLRQGWPGRLGRHRERERVCDGACPGTPYGRPLADGRRARPRPKGEVDRHPKGRNRAAGSGSRRRAASRARSRRDAPKPLEIRFRHLETYDDYDATPACPANG
jgi:hypothetical protein